MTEGAPATIEDVARLLEQALVGRDMDLFGSLLDPRVRWGDDDHPRTCRTSDEVLATFSRLIDEGAEAEISELEVGELGVLFALDVKFPSREEPNTAVRFQVYLVSDGKIVEIRGYDDRQSAAEAAALRG